MWLILKRRIALLILFSGAAQGQTNLAYASFALINVLQTQENPMPPPLPPKPQFFSGTVTELRDDHVVVSRTLFGHPPEIHTFLITPQTQKNKALKVKVRVTVRYQSSADGDIALEIQIRSQAKPAKAS